MTIYSGKDNTDYYYCKDCDIVQFEEWLLTSLLFILYIAYMIYDIPNFTDEQLQGELRSTIKYAQALLEEIDRREQEK